MLPFSFSLQVCVFDFGPEFYVWQGKGVTMEQRKLGMKLAKQLYDKGYDYSMSAVSPFSPLRSKIWFFFDSQVQRVFSSIL